MIDLLQSAASPLAFARHTLQFQPDEVQARILSTPERRILINCCRQWGKSTTTAALVAYTLWHLSGALVLLLAPTARQSAEIFRKVLEVTGQTPLLEAATSATAQRFPAAASTVFPCSSATCG